MTNSEKVAYIRGLAEGLELDASKKEVKVLNAIIELLEDMALSIADVEDNMSDMAAQLDEVDADLGAMEEDFYMCEGDEDEEDDDDDDCFCDDDCFYEVTCPNCNETICLSEDMICDGQIDCPSCGELLEFEIDDCDDDCCDCGCCDHEH